MSYRCFAVYLNLNGIYVLTMLKKSYFLKLTEAGYCLTDLFYDFVSILLVYVAKYRMS